MSRFVTIHSILAPVDVATLERADDLRILGDKSCEIGSDGISSRRVDESGNLMGAIAVLWHDAPIARSADVESFISRFSSHPIEIRKEVVEDPDRTEAGDCGRYFQNAAGEFHFYEGYLLVAPTKETVEEFFFEGRAILT